MNGSYVCFSGQDRIAQGTLSVVAEIAWRMSWTDPTISTLTFNRQTGEVVDLNLSGSLLDIANRYSPISKSTIKRGRPKLGVVAREITLLPQHWEWLGRQPGGASVALRRLVEGARKNSSGDEAIRERIAAAYKFMSAIAGDLPLFEEASRALFARQKSLFAQHISTWPIDIQDEMNQMTAQVR
jgi:hypothetical protein